MCNSHRRSTGVLLTFITLWTGHALAENTGPLGEVKGSVMAMIQSETRIAMFEQQERERKVLGGPVVPAVSQPSTKAEPIVKAPEENPQPTKPKISTAEVVGIWGLGDRLLADVRIDGQTLRFQRGSRYPQGYGSGSPYTLVSIQTPCVTFADKGVARKVCIDNINLDTTQ